MKTLLYSLKFHLLDLYGITEAWSTKLIFTLDVKKQCYFMILNNLLDNIYLNHP